MLPFGQNCLVLALKELYQFILSLAKFLVRQKKKKRLHLASDWMRPQQIRAGASKCLFGSHAPYASAVSQCEAK